MSDTIESRLATAGVVLPEPAAPIASYVPAVEAGGLLYVSGQLPFAGEKLMTGRLGEDRDIEYGQQAARACAIMIIAQAKQALAGLGGIERIVKLGVFVNSASHFTDQPKVANGASDLMEDAFGEAGRHARSAVGVPALPLGAAVEVDAVIALRRS
ncbi:MAG: RidA family protein [Sphingomonadaceae bacterium]